MCAQNISGKILPETPESSVGKVIQIVFHRECFALEGNVFVGEVTVVEFEIPVIVLYDIPQIKENH